MAGSKTSHQHNVNDSFDFTILSNTFEMLPSKHDYTVTISADALVSIRLIHDELEFELYAAEVS